MTKWGLSKLRCQELAMIQWYLNTQYDNGVSAVVRARESLVHGEGKQVIILNTKLDWCVRHYEKSRSSIK